MENSLESLAPMNGNRQRRRLVVGITGASGVILGIRMLEYLKMGAEIETHLIISPAAKTTIASETEWSTKDVESLAEYVYNNRDIGAAPASGSFATMGMVISRPASKRCPRSPTATTPTCWRAPPTSPSRRVARSSWCCARRPSTSATFA